MNTILKSLILLVAMFLASAFQAHSHEKTVFVHGINSSGGMWTSGYNMVGKLQANGWRMTPIAPTRNDAISFWAQSSDLQSSIPSMNYVAVTHSMGAPASRTLIKRYGASSKIYKLVTLNGANQSAEIARSVYDGSLAWFIGNQTTAIIGPWVQEFIDWGIISELDVINFMLAGITQLPLDMLVANDAMFDLSGLGGAGYGYIQSENDNVAKATIIGRELDLGYEFYRTAATYVGYYPQTGEEAQNFLMDLYWSISFFCYELADYYDSYIWNGQINPDYDPFLADEFYYRGDAFYWSVVQLNNSSYYWRWVNGGNLYINGQMYWAYTDGVLPEYSQWNPNVTANPIFADGTNHALITQTHLGRDVIGAGFSAVLYDNNPLQSSFSVSIQPYPEYGSNWWRAVVSNGSGNYQYSWYVWDPTRSPGGGGGGGGEPYGPLIGGDGWISHGSGPYDEYIARPGYKIKVVVLDISNGAQVENILAW